MLMIMMIQARVYDDELRQQIMGCAGTVVTALERGYVCLLVSEDHYRSARVSHQDFSTRRRNKEGKNVYDLKGTKIGNFISFKH